MYVFFSKKNPKWCSLLILLISFLLLFSNATVYADQPLLNDKIQYSSNSLFSGNEEKIQFKYDTEKPSDIQSQLPMQNQILPTTDLSFIPNSGLTNPSVQYFVKEGDRTFFFTDERIILSVRGKIEKTIELDQVFIDMSGPTSLEAKDLLPGTVNFFFGKNPSNWKKNILTYGSITYKNVYPGINLVLDGKNGELVPEISIVPGADTNHLEVSLNGIDIIKKFLQTGKNDQTSDDSGMTIRSPGLISIRQLSNLKSFTGNMQPDRKNNLTFIQNTSDKTKDMSHLLYSTYLGGTGNESGTNLAVDSEGNVFIIGKTSSINFPMSPLAQQTGYGGGSYDVFITKLNANGTRVLYSTYLGGDDEDVGFGVDVDSAGNAYITGYTWSTNFPSSSGAFQTNYAGNEKSEKTLGGDAFIAKLSPTGNNLEYSTYIGGNSSDRGDAITIDTDGNAFITGASESTNYPISEGAYQPGHNGWGDVIITKINSKGNVLLYSTYLGGSGAETGYAIDTDSEGNAYLTGVVWYGQFPTTPEAFQTTFGGGMYDTFAVKINPEGTGLIYSTYLGGNNQEVGHGITIDSFGAAYVTGYTGSQNYPTTPGAFQVKHGGSEGDVFITKIDPSGESLIYSSFLGGSGFESGESVIIDSSENAYIIGQTSSKDFPITENAYQKSNRGESDIFITVLGNSGFSVLYSSYIGGAGSENGDCIGMDSYGNMYLTGGSSSINYPVTDGVVQLSNQGNSDVIMSKFGVSPVPKTPDIFGMILPVPPVQILNTSSLPSLFSQFELIT